MSKRYTFGAIASSQNPEEIANKVRGGVLALSSIIIFLVAKFFGVVLSANDMISLATELGTIAGAIWAVYGSGLHVLAVFFRKEI